MSDEVPKRPKGPAQAWMLSFADLISLMLVFFVLLFSMSSIKVDKWETLVDALTRRLAPTDERVTPVPSAAFNVGTVFHRTAEPLDYLHGLLERTIRVDDALSGTLLFRLEDRLVLSLPGDLLFPTGQVELGERAERAVFNLGGVLRNIANRVGVVGHSDPVPIIGRDGPYASNWELSIARAAAVANALSQAGYAENIVALGAAESRFPLLENLPEDRRFDVARRVDVVIFEGLAE